MKISLVSFFQNNNIQRAPKYTNLGPLLRDTVTFGANKPKDVKYSVYQKDREVRLIQAVINAAIKEERLLDADEISEKTGLDVCVVKLRLSTNTETRRLYNKLKYCVLMKAKLEKEAKVKCFKEFFERLKESGEKLTEREILLYLGCDENELSELMKEFPQLVPLYKENLLKVKRCNLVEKDAQIKSINRAFNKKLVRDKYPDFAKKAGLDIDIVRTRISEDEGLFNLALGKNLYPPEIYSAEEIEKQDETIMNVLLYILKKGLPADIETVAKKANLPAGVVQIRIDFNHALKGTHNRALGIDEDEN